MSLPDISDAVKVRKLLIAIEQIKEWSVEGRKSSQWIRGLASATLADYPPLRPLDLGRFVTVDHFYDCHCAEKFIRYRPELCSGDGHYDFDAVVCEDCQASLPEAPNSRANEIMKAPDILAQLSEPQIAQLKDMAEHPEKYPNEGASVSNAPDISQLAELKERDPQAANQLADLSAKYAEQVAKTQSQKEASQ